MKNKLLFSFIVLINIALVAIIICHYLNTDHVAPTFTYSTNETVYTDDVDETLLYEGINASDNVDGDVTDRIVIEKIVVDPTTNRATVTYAVSDKSGNVAKAARVFKSNIKKPSTVSTNTSESTDTDNTPSIDIDAIREEIRSELQDEVSESVRSELRDELYNEIKTELEASANTAPAVAPAANTPATTSNTDDKSGDKKKSAPSITLRSTTIKTPAGIPPAWVDIVAGLNDKNDSYGDLFKTLKYTSYNLNEKGNHQVQLTVTNSAGIESAPVSVTVIVQ